MDCRDAGPTAVALGEVAGLRGCPRCGQLGVELVQELIQQRLLMLEILPELHRVRVRDLHPEIGHIAVEHLFEDSCFLLG
jgi:hypothetical protein